MEYYTVGIIEEERKVSIDGEETMLDLVWHDDMVGVMPVFNSREEAENYSQLWDSKPPVMELSKLKRD